MWVSDDAMCSGGCLTPAVSSSTVSTNAAGPRLHESSKTTEVTSPMSLNHQEYGFPFDEGRRRSGSDSVGAELLSDHLDLEGINAALRAMRGRLSVLEGYRPEQEKCSQSLDMLSRSLHHLHESHSNLRLCFSQSREKMQERLSKLERSGEERLKHEAKRQEEHEAKHLQHRADLKAVYEDLSMKQDGIMERVLSTCRDTTSSCNELAARFHRTSEEVEKRLADLHQKHEDLRSVVQANPSGQVLHAKCEEQATASGRLIEDLSWRLSEAASQASSYTDRRLHQHSEAVTGMMLDLDKRLGAEIAQAQANFGSKYRNYHNATNHALQSLDERLTERIAHSLSEASAVERAHAKLECSERSTRSEASLVAGEAMELLRRDLSEERTAQLVQHRLAEMFADQALRLDERQEELDSSMTRRVVEATEQLTEEMQRMATVHVTELEDHRRAVDKTLEEILQRQHDLRSDLAFMDREHRERVGLIARMHEDQREDLARLAKDKEAVRDPDVLGSRPVDSQKDLAESRTSLRPEMPLLRHKAPSVFELRRETPIRSAGPIVGQAHRNLRPASPLKFPSAASTAAP